MGIKTSARRQRIVKLLGRIIVDNIEGIEPGHDLEVFFTYRIANDSWKGVYHERTDKIYMNAEFPEDILPAIKEKLLWAIGHEYGAG